MLYWYKSTNTDAEDAAGTTVYARSRGKALGSILDIQSFVVVDETDTAESAVRLNLGTLRLDHLIKESTGNTDFAAG